MSPKETRLGVTADHRPMASWIPWQRNERYEREILQEKKTFLRFFSSLISDCRSMVSLLSH